MAERPARRRAAWHSAPERRAARIAGPPASQLHWRQAKLYAFKAGARRFIGRLAPELGERISAEPPFSLGENASRKLFEQRSDLVDASGTVDARERVLGGCRAPACGDRAHEAFLRRGTLYGGFASLASIHPATLPPTSAAHNLC